LELNIKIQSVYEQSEIKLLVTLAIRFFGLSPCGRTDQMIIILKYNKCSSIYLKSTSCKFKHTVESLLNKLTSNPSKLSIKCPENYHHLTLNHCHKFLICMILTNKTASLIEHHYSPSANS